MPEEPTTDPHTQDDGNDDKGGQAELIETVKRIDGLEKSINSVASMLASLAETVTKKPEDTKPPTEDERIKELESRLSKQTEELDAMKNVLKVVEEQRVKEIEAKKSKLVESITAKNPSLKKESLTKLDFDMLKTLDMTTIPVHSESRFSGTGTKYKETREEQLERIRKQRRSKQY